MGAINVLYDHQVFATQRFGGVSRYFVELARAMQALSGVHAKLFAPAYLNEYIESRDTLHALSFCMKRFPRGLHYRPAMLGPLLWLALRMDRPQILHETSQDQFRPCPLPSTRVVTTVHDMTVEKFPELFDGPESRIAAKVAGMQRADAIICISECTRADLVGMYPEFADRCSVVHHGVTRVLADGLRPQALPEHYLLYVGHRRHYKNFDTLIRALGSAKRLPASLKLVCFGGGRLSAEEDRLCAQAGWPTSRILQMDGSDAMLARAYRHAALFVFPSRYEGFGMPLTEAMVQSCPITCSRASSFPEVCGDAATYFDPDDANDIAHCIESIVMDPARRSSLSVAAECRGRIFDWQRCAEGTLQIYRQVIGLESRQ